MDYKKDSFFFRNDSYEFNTDIPDLYDEKDEYKELFKTVEIFKESMESNPIPPDSYSYELYIVKYFIKDEMKKIFPYVAKDFFLSEFANITSYDDIVPYIDILSGNESPDYKINCFIVALMINAVNRGSDVAKKIFIYLEKNYYKKEYNSLKRFTSISADEVLLLAKPSDGHSIPECAINIARILFMSKLQGIHIGNDCSCFYILLRGFIVEEESDRYKYRNKLYDKYKTTCDEVLANFNMRKMYSAESKLSKFTGNIFKWLGFGFDYADLCQKDKSSIEEQLAVTLTVLRDAFPGKEFKDDELMLYNEIFYVASALANISDWISNSVKNITYGDEINADGYIGFSEGIKKIKEQQKTETIKTEKATQLPIENDVFNIEKDTLVSEIDKLRRKIHLLETDNSQLRAELSIKRKVEEESRSTKDKLNIASRELAALRTYVYNLSNEQEDVIDEVSLEDMKDAVKKKHIIIIGGHLKWVSKMKKEFPEWTYISPDANGVNDPKIVGNADYVYFYTDILTHSTYYKFISFIRDNKVPFGYIHGKNIESVIKQIYQDQMG